MLFLAAIISSYYLHCSLKMSVMDFFCQFVLMNDQKCAALFETTVKPRFKAPRFNTNPDLTRLIPFPQNFGRFFGRCSKKFSKISFIYSVFERYRRGDMSSDANAYAIIRCQVSLLPHCLLHETAVRQAHACCLTPVGQ
jgi:hypothetical protein